MRKREVGSKVGHFMDPKRVIFRLKVSNFCSKLVILRSKVGRFVSKMGNFLGAEVFFLKWVIPGSKVNYFQQVFTHKQKIYNNKNDTTQIN